jgi:5S rRNA maturation endonuclease (ribonuclease M5)
VKLGERLRKLDIILDRLRDSWVLAEGQRDRLALTGLGVRKVLTISGNLRASCGLLGRENADKAYVLSDLDRRGDELAKTASDELGSLSIRADTGTRLELAHLLRIRHFEDAKRAYDKLKDEMAEKGENNG